MREGDVVPPPPPLAAPGGPAQPSPRERRAGSQRSSQPFSLREKDTEPLRGRLLPRSEPRGSGTPLPAAGVAEESREAQRAGAARRHLALRQPCPWRAPFCT